MQGRIPQKPIEVSIERIKIAVSRYYYQYKRGFYFFPQNK
ncbi:hypothetical protein TREVI0001_0896 [Treponema vincentii ATCC 35580]|uniref:Uncharacterized protein n=1 Tax=Treponema vincentii ATCC 35580 TaxID=596324 RepID=C8PR26_9SPIR|nr:hypothetical protein TREVI0001_0896 [Treponema vincentii ATCC 35580]